MTLTKIVNRGDVGVLSRRLISAEVKPVERRREQTHRDDNLGVRQTYIKADVAIFFSRAT